MIHRIFFLFYTQDMEFHMEARENTIVGQKFNVTLLARNLGLEHRSLKTSFYCKAVNHYGDTVGMCREFHVGTEYKAKEGNYTFIFIVFYFAKKNLRSLNPPAWYSYLTSRDHRWVMLSNSVVSLGAMRGLLDVGPFLSK